MKHDHQSHKPKICAHTWTTKSPYAHMLIVVAFLIVMFFGLLVIARNPPERVWRKMVEMLAFNLPDLPKNLQDLQKQVKTMRFRDR